MSYPTNAVAPHMFGNAYKNVLVVAVAIEIPLFEPFFSSHFR